MKRRIAYLIVTLAAFTSTAFAESYSTEAKMIRQKETNTYTAAIRVSKIVEHDGKQVEQLIAQPRVISSPGQAASTYQGLQASNPDYEKTENVSVDVDWPPARKSGFARCTVVVKLGNKVVSKSKLQVSIEEP